MNLHCSWRYIAISQVIVFVYSGARLGRVRGSSRRDPVLRRRDGSALSTTKFWVRGQNNPESHEGRLMPPAEAGSPIGSLRDLCRLLKNLNRTARRTYLRLAEIKNKCRGDTTEVVP